MSEWYEIKNTGNIDTPALLIHPDRVKHNIATAISMVKDISLLRPHVKTNKCAEACTMMLDQGITKFKCATIAEAEMLGTIGAPDVLLAYQPVGPKAGRFISLVQHFRCTSFSCLVDNEPAAQAIAAAATSAGITITVFIDLNVGMNRTGIVPGEAAVNLFKVCRQTPGIEAIGLHAYDGHITDIDFEVREQRCAEAYAKVEWMENEIMQAGLPKPKIVAGGSPSFPVHAKWGKAECSPGTFVYWDAGYIQKYHEQAFLPAALVVSRVISLPDNTTVCTDLGHKSIAAENPLPNRVALLNAGDVQFAGQSEEHLVLKAPKDHHYRVGDILYGIPYHICPTCALYERASIVTDHEVTSEWRIVARDRKISI